jgi:hypothetical protein
MKVLHLNAYFLLPDNFTGSDLNKALEALVAYRTAKG